MTPETDTIIIGAGPAGLAVGAVLLRADVPFLMLERGQHVGESWHHHYERLHLHTPKRHSALPFRPFPRSYPRYPSRQQVLEYLEEYARAFELRPEFGRQVRQCVRTPDGAWEVWTDSGRYRGRRVVVATGMNGSPNVPRWPGQDSFPGQIIHSRDYTTGAAFLGQRVLVVGFGNSGAEIALDLCEHDVRCAIAVRGKVNVIPRDVLGIPIVDLALALRALPPRVADRMNRLTLRLTIGNLSTLGLAKRDEGPIVQITEGRQIPVIDVGTLARMRGGDIGVRKGIEAFDGAEVCFVDRTRERFDAVVLATGFAPGITELLPDHASLFDVRGYPRDHGRETASPGLYFCGFELARGGLLRQVGIEARRIGREITAARARGSSNARVPHAV